MEAATCRDFRQVRTEGSRSVERSIPRYNLDMIISVGYPLKSGVATRFRIWATDRLREHLVRGAAINADRLEQLGLIVSILARSVEELVAGVADVLAGYLPGLTLLRDYDAGQLEAPPGTVPGWQLTIDEARSVIAQVGARSSDDALFGRERGGAREGVVASIYQGFGGEQLYPTAQTKAANLLSLVVKDHPLSEGNKPSAAALFVTFLARNGVLTDALGSPQISNNALAAVTLLIAMSDPKEKELMISARRAHAVRLRSLSLIDGEDVADAAAMVTAGESTTGRPDRLHLAGAIQRACDDPATRLSTTALPARATAETATECRGSGRR